MIDMNTSRRLPYVTFIALILTVSFVPCPIRAQIQSDNGLSFELSFPAAVHSGPMTGRAYIVISETGNPEPRIQSGGDLATGIPMWGKNFYDVNPGEGIVIGENSFGKGQT